MSIISLSIFSIGQAQTYSVVTGLENDTTLASVGNESMHANGTINDWYAALPSHKAIPNVIYAWNSRAQIIYGLGGPTTWAAIAPIWEVGPHNQHDDYWNSDPPDLTASNYSNGTSCDTCAIRDIYRGMSVWWTVNSDPRYPPSYWNTNDFALPTSGTIPMLPSSDNLLGPSNPEVVQALNTYSIDEDENGNPVTVITPDTYNWGCDEFGRWQDRSNSQLTDTAIGISLGVASVSGLQGNSLVNWGFTNDLPAVTHVQIADNNGKIYFDKLRGQKPTVNNPLPLGSTIAVSIFFNQSMNPDSANNSVSFSPQNGSGPSVSFTPVPLDPPGWFNTNYGYDTWVGTAVIPKNYTGNQVLQIHFELYGLGQGTQGTINQIDSYEGVDNKGQGQVASDTVYQPGTDQLNIFRVYTRSYVHAVTISQNTFPIYQAAWPLEPTPQIMVTPDGNPPFPVTILAAAPAVAVNTSANLGSVHIDMNFYYPMVNPTTTPLAQAPVPTVEAYYPVTPTGTITCTWPSQKGWCATLTRGTLGVTSEELKKNLWLEISQTEILLTQKEQRATNSILNTVIFRKRLKNIWIMILILFAIRSYIAIATIHSRVISFIISCSISTSLD